MTEYTISSFKREVRNRSLFTTDMQNIFTAIITFPNGDWMGVSLWEGESVWRADCAFRENGYPVFSCGTGNGMRGLPDDAAGPLNDAAVAWLEEQGTAETLA